jgi:DNA-binding transcriptional regulator YhcF (GntR family)
MQLQNNNNFSQSQISQYHLPFQPIRKYFTATPNLILDHPELDIYDQMLYIHIKRIAGDNGQCWASIRYLAGKMKVSKSQVQKSLQKLLKLGLIRHAGTKKIKTRPRNVYEIVDIWEMNLNYYSNHQNNNETIENQEEVIHNHNSGDCPQYGQTPKDCPPYGQTQTAKPKKSIKNQQVKPKKRKPKKNHIKKEKQNSSSSRKNDDDVDKLNKPQPAQKEVITKGEGLFSNINIQPLIDKFGIDRVLFVMDLINYRYKYKLVSHPFKLLLKILKDRYLIHNEFYRFIRGKNKGDSVPVLITCKSCNHKGIAELKVGGKYSIPCSKCGTFAEIDLIIKL